jgi:molybdenum cofactor cytidylyltransferase
MTIHGILLAAGGARRFGSAKQLADFDGKPMAQRALDALDASSVDRVVVVLGARASEIRDALCPGRAELVDCPDWDEGMAASLRCGIALARDADWALVTLADVPSLPTAAIDAIAQAARDAPPGVDAVRASWKGDPGHPVALRASLFPRLRALTGDTGARAVLAGARAHTVECSGYGEAPDVDTPEDLAAARRATA